MTAEILHHNLAPNFGLRLATQKKFEEIRRSRGDREYTYLNGEYSESLVNYIQSLAKELLQAKRLVILLDIGGGKGKSWGRIAEGFKTEIQESRIAFVVSSIDLPKKPEQWIHHVVGFFSELPDKTIILPSGVVVPLLKNVNVMHESCSLTSWSLIPETDIMNIGILASSNSTYLVPKIDTIRFNGDLVEEDRHIREGVEIAHRKLQDKFGFTKTENQNINTIQFPEMPYLIFSR